MWYKGVIPFTICGSGWGRGLLCVAGWGRVNRGWHMLVWICVKLKNIPKSGKYGNGLRLNICDSSKNFSTFADADTQAPARRDG